MTVNRFDELFSMSRAERATLGRTVEPSPYAKAALDAEVRKVSTAVEGTRNETLNLAAFALGQLVGGGELDRGAVLIELTKAARACGLHLGEATRTAESGLDAGAAQPRTAPATPNLRHADEPASLDVRPTVVTLADTEPERVSYLWAGRLPLGKLVVVDGDPSTGKSTLTLDFAARVTVGAAWPDGEPGCQPSDVVLLSAEDGIRDTIVPRLTAAGADLARVHALTEVPVRGDDGNCRMVPPSLPRDLAHIERVVVEHRAKLLVVDVLMAYLSAKVDSHRDQDVRGVLHQLSAMAERTGCTVILVRHLNKAGGSNALYRGGGSIGIVGAARAGFLVARDPEDDARRIFAVTKMNLAAEPPSLAYRLVCDPHNDCARIEWEADPVEHTATSLLRHPTDDDERTERDEAAEWLTSYLEEQGGSAKAGDALRAARRDGISERTLKRARGRAGIESTRQGFGGGSVWSIQATVVPFRPRSEAGPNGTNGGPNEVGP